MTPVVRLEGVVKTFTRTSGRVSVLAGLDAEFTPGEVVIIRGRSGSGKTTLLNLLAGWQTPDVGSVVWGIANHQSWLQVAVVPQSLGLLPELTLGENVRLPMRLAGADGDVEAAAERLDIDSLLDRPVAAVSLGEQQRAAVARATIGRPALLLADEPSSHQDLDRLHLVWTAIAGVAATGSCAVVTTHDPAALQYADRVLDLKDGRLVRSS